MAQAIDCCGFSRSRVACQSLPVAHVCGMPKIMWFSENLLCNGLAGPGGLAHFADPHAKISPHRLAAGVSALAQTCASSRTLFRDTIIGCAVAGLAGLGFRVSSPRI